MPKANFWNTSHREPNHVGEIRKRAASFEAAFRSSKRDPYRTLLWHPRLRPLCHGALEDG